MLKLVCDKNDRFEVSKIELEQERQLFTIETLRILQKQYLNYEIYFTMGSDNLKELETIDSYLLDQNVYEIELKLEDNKIALVEKSLINYKEKGAIEIIKVDENAQVLAGAEFALYNEDMEEVTTATTDDTGRIYIGNLSLGKYFLREVKAPEGYQLIDELIALEIKNDMEVITVKVTNDSIDIAVPDTQIEFKIDKYILKKKKISL